MKILVFTHRTNFSGGANRSLLAVLKGLKSNGHNIHVVLPRKCGELNDALDDEEIKWFHMQYYRMGAKSFPRLGRIGKIISNFIVYAKLVHHYFVSKRVINLMKTENYDIVDTNTILPYCGLFAAKKYKIPSVLHDREPLIGTGVLQIKKFEDFLFKYSDAIIVISNDLRKQWRDLGYTEKIILINNGIPLENVVHNEQEIVDTLNILLTARITSSKNHTHALKAITLLKKKGINNIRLFFAGSEGEKSDQLYKQELIDFIRSNDLNENVVFLGEVKDMSSLRSNMHIELMCNPNEPYGRVTVEGMRSGLVVVGVKAGGTLDIIDDMKTGIFYEKGNINELSEKIKLVYKDSYIRKSISKYAYEYGNTHFTIEENVKSIEKVLIDTLNKFSGEII